MKNLSKALFATLFVSNFIFADTSSSSSSATSTTEAPIITHGYTGKREDSAVQSSSNTTTTSPEIATTTEAPFKRWGVAPYIGGSHPTSRLKGFKLYPAFSIGVKSTYNFLEFAAVGLQVNADFIHFSYDEVTDQGQLEVSSITPVLLLEFQIPKVGIYFGPTGGFSYKSYAYRKSSGLFSYRDGKGTENFLAYGGFAGWSFKIGKRVSMGPRFDFVNYAPIKTVYLNNYSTLNAYFTTKFSF